MYFTDFNETIVRIEVEIYLHAYHISGIQEILVFFNPFPCSQDILFLLHQVCFQRNI